ncbi:MAG TPA: hypothetical protein VEC99_12030 [Clostridia bacterium]|nr:hypothetical protein [Clostridia bacterium]
MTDGNKSEPIKPTQSIAQTENMVSSLLMDALATNYLIQLTGQFVVQSEIPRHHELIDLALNSTFSEEKSTASHVKTLEFPTLKSSPVPDPSSGLKSQI